MKMGNLFSLCAVSLLMSASAAFPQTTGAPAFPNQTVRIIVPFTAGSNTDILARFLADKLGTLWKQTVIVENRPGIPGTISVANSAPDGHTLMVTSNGHTIIGALNKDLTIDPIKDFSGVIQIASVPVVLVVPPPLPVKNLKELIDLAKEKPGTLNFTSAGLASSNYIAGEMFKQSAKIDIAHIPYKGTPETLTSLMRGEAQITLAFLSTAQGQIQGGQLRALAIAAPKRSPIVPDVPTFAEAGMPEFQYDAWFGLMAPAKTPPSTIKKINDDIASIVQTPDAQKRWETLGATPVVSTPDQFDTTIRSDADRYGKLLKAAGVNPN
jgi:tripartite-type tricarboxylate transporter receptor subunit TctC